MTQNATRDGGIRPPSAIKRYIISQFGNPRGLVGRLAGLLMRRRASNVRRNLWTVELMELKPTDRVLEIGYGPGFALEQVCRRVTQGKAVGLDRSATMFDMASGWNRQAIDDGRLTLLVGSVEGAELDKEPALAGPFDRIYAVNVVIFWRDPVAVLAALGKRLAPDGRILLTYQPRISDRTDAGALAAADRIAGQMKAAGLGDVRIETLKEISPMAVCVIGQAKTG